MFARDESVVTIIGRPNIINNNCYKLIKKSQFKIKFSFLKVKFY